jgi:[acyl-carrier-protein] S-malonyltransferase
MRRPMQIAWLFPGQGSQSVGMGQDVLGASAAARDVFERADGALAEALSKTILEGPEEALTLTANTQPAIVTVSCAILAVIRERVASGAVPASALAPAFAAGHSLGEYSALVAAGALTLEDAVRLVRARGRAMQEAVAPGDGAMAAIMGLDAARLEELCAQAAAVTGCVVSCANFNAPGQIVIAGDAAGVARVSELAGAERAKAIPLKVSAPFHCTRMAPAADAVERELRGVEIAPLAFPVVANVDAQPNRDPARVKDLLVRQVTGTVRWEQAMVFMKEQGVTHALEIGPGKVLAGLAKRCAKEIKVLSVNDVASLDQLASFLAG